MKRQSSGMEFLMRIIRDAVLAVSLVRDYWRGSYRAPPAFSLVAIVLALLYVLSPLDLLPDVIPLVGIVDDALVMFVCLKLVENDLRAYEAWRGHLDRDEWHF